MAADRIQEHTAPSVQTSILGRTEEKLRVAAGQGAVDERLAELDREWDAERVLFTASGLNVLLGLALGRWVDRRWLAYVAGVAAFQVQHGVQGWCPPLALIRRLRFRSRREIADERTALKALRGDFAGLGTGADPNEALTAARR